VASSTSHIREPNARMVFTVEVEGLPQLTQLLASVRAVAGVEFARRK
jgi:hypothetical protein